MTNHPSREEIASILGNILLQALRRDPSKIKPECRIFDDLGAESLDILDVRFRIERTFGFKIEQDEIARYVGEGLTNQQIRDKFTVQSLVDFIEHRLTQSAQLA